MRLMRDRDRERTSAARVEAALHANADDLLAFAERRVGRDDAPDVLAEVMLVAWRRTAELPGDPSEARMWLFGVARGVIANARRGQLRRHQLADRLRAQTRPQAQGAPADQGVEVRDAIDRLEPDLAEVVRLVHWDWLSLTDAARLLDTPPSTIRSRYAKARAQLADALHPAPSSPA